MVFIKKVTMKGFKSYGPRKIAVTMSPGFTCIVGPNGSGKSNVVDAVAFVIGRQSSKQLRAGVFSDLIYGGSKKIKGSKFAEVAIHLDNTDGKLPVDSQEVIISRSIDASGKTVYRVNKKRETRTYVVDLLAHADIFPEGHNIVLQGDITQFIKMSSEDRRGVIEEISGIAEYNEKKERGQRELDKANENIARMELVLNEVSSRLEKLEKEKNDATRYKELRQDIYRHKGWLVKGELKSVGNSHARVSETMASHAERKTKCESRIAELERLLEENESELDASEREIEKLSEERQVALAREIEEIRGRKRMSESETSRTRLTIETLSRQKENLQKEKCRLEEEKKRWEEKILSEKETGAKNSDLMREKEREYERMLEGLSRSREVLDELKGRLEETESRLAEKRQAVLTLRTEVERIISEAKFAKERKKEIEEELVTTRHDGEEIQEILRRAGEKQVELKSCYDALCTSLGELKEEEKKARDTHLALEDDIWKKRLHASQLSARLAAQKESEAIRKNLGSGISDILEARNKGIIQGIHGTIASLGKTEEQYRSALEVAAGNRLNNIVVDTDETARRCIMYLKEKKSGRATFLPLNTLQGFSLKETRPAEEGVIDYAINLIKFQAQFAVAFRYVFGDTLVVETIEDTKNRRERMVTLDGDIVERSGAITGGHFIKARYLSSFSIESDEEDASRFGKEIESLESKKGELEATLARLAENIQEKEKAVFAHEREMALLSSQFERENASFIEKEEREKSLSGKVEELNSVIDHKKKISEDHLAEIEKTESDIRSLEEIRRGVSAKLSFEGMDLGTIEKEMTSLREILKRGELDIQEAFSKIGFIEERMAAIDETVRNIESDFASEGDCMKSFLLQAETIEKELKDKLEEEQSFAVTLSKKRNARDNLKNLLEGRRKEKESLKEEIYGLASKLEVLGEHKKEHEQRLAELEEESKNYIVEGEYKDLKELRFRIANMEKEKESLEPINMRAIEEYDEVLARHSLLSTRTEKLYEERKSILDFIAEVEGQKKSVFMNIFSRISENFSKIFAELSPEGTARLMVENEEDPFLEGIDLEANPGGKEVKRVEAMSGGEKALTALAFVFAIQRFKPAPFYILDEIDMHLDDVNCKRVAEMIKESSKATQFMVITLRDVMMAASELLYGVTIKSGLSKILSVKLEEIAQYKEPIPTVE